MAMEDTIPKTDFIWHKSSIDKGIYLTLASIQMQDGDTAIPRDGFLDTNYILHHQSAGGEHLVVPLAADVTTANVPDNKMYVSLNLLFQYSLYHLYCIQ